MGTLAKVAIVLSGDIGCDHLAIRLWQRVGSTQQNLRQLIQRLCSFRAECHGSENSRNAFGQSNMCHRNTSSKENYLFTVVTGGFFQSRRAYPMLAVCFPISRY